MGVKLIFWFNLKTNVPLLPSVLLWHNLNCCSNGGQPGVNIISFCLVWRDQRWDKLITESEKGGVERVGEEEGGGRVEAGTGREVEMKLFYSWQCMANEKPRWRPAKQWTQCGEDTSFTSHCWCCSSSPAPLDVLSAAPELGPSPAPCWSAPPWLADDSPTGGTQRDKGAQKVSVHQPRCEECLQQPNNLLWNLYHDI